MPQRPIATLLAQIRKEAVQRGYTGTQLARELGIDQSGASRMLKGPGPRTLNKTMRKTCEVLGVNIYSVTPVGSELPATVVAAVRSIWDGTEGHAQAIAKMVASLNAVEVANALVPKQRRRNMKLERHI